MSETFSMSCYANSADLYKAKAEYFEKLATDKQGEVEKLTNENKLLQNALTNAQITIRSASGTGNGY